ncbi:GerAB/ArcD/ProY family transporter [Cohnella sp. REN36]|uniref:GerAB/ArcD/ProY family transporter n=1 Tax=Cohnella sp. REN36 TaxID=2887347 RepID=UPI001D13C319|nr:spore germination protein [Cohnella sp. REN36]
MKEKLNRFHIGIFIYMIELDVTVFSLPRLVAENFGTNGWLGLLALSLVAFANIGLIHFVYRLGKGRSIFQIIETALPKWCAYPLYVLLAGFWLSVGAFIGKDFILIFQMLAFQSTDSMLIFFMYCLMAYFLLIKDLYSIMKAVTLFFILTTALNGLFPFFFQEWKLIRLTTSFFQDAQPGGHSLYGMAEMYTVFVGYELCMLMFPYVNEKSKLFQGVYFGQLFTVFLQQLFVWVSFGFFSFPELKVLSYPLIHTLEYVEFPFINRMENLIFPFFLFSNLLSTVFFSFASMLCLRRIFPQARPKLIEFFLILGVFLLGYIPKILRQSELLVRHSYFIEIGIAIVLPLLLLLFIKVGQWRQKEVKV